MRADTHTPRKKPPADFYDKLEKNKQAFETATTEEDGESKAPGGGRDNAAQLLKTLKAMKQDSRQYTEEQEAYIKRVIKQLEEGALPKQTTMTAGKALEKERKDSEPNPLKRLAILQKKYPVGATGKPYRAERRAHRRSEGSHLVRIPGCRLTGIHLYRR